MAAPLLVWAMPYPAVESTTPFALWALLCCCCCCCCCWVALYGLPAACCLLFAWAYAQLHTVAKSKGAKAKVVRLPFAFGYLCFWLLLQLAAAAAAAAAAARL